MKADDIRTLNERMQEQMLNSQTIGEQEAGFKSLLLSLLSELAAQQAEANENLKRVINPPLMYDTSNIDPADWPELPQPVMMLNGPRDTLRDQFAMTAIIGNWDDQKEMTNTEYASWAYKLADAMLEARNAR